MNASPQQSRRETLLFMLMCAIWGTTWIAIRAGVAAVPPLLFAATRFTAAGSILLIGSVLLKKEFARPDFRDYARFALASVLMIALCYGLLFWGMTRVNSGLAAVLELSCTPLALIGFSVALREEAFSWRRMRAIAVGVVGLAILFGPTAGFESAESVATTATGDVVGAAAIIVAAIVYGLGSVLARPLFTRYTPVSVAGVTMLVGGTLLLIASVNLEPPAGIALEGHWGLAAWCGWLFLVIFGSLIAFTIYLRLVQVWGSSRAGSYAFVSPVIAVLLGAAVYGERVDLYEVFGMIILLVAAYLAVAEKT